MKKLLYCLAVVVAVAVMVSCEKDPEKTTEPKDIAFVEYSLEGTDAEWTNYLRDNEIWENTIIVIDSDEELREYVSGDYPEVDFTEKTLLLAGGWAGEVEPQDHTIYKFSDRYELTINLVLLSLSDYEAEWKSAVIVDKLPAESRVELKVTRSALVTGRFFCVVVGMGIAQSFL